MGRELAIHSEAQRLADLWNGTWMHHLNEADIAALIEAGRLHDLTHTFTPGRGEPGTGWQPKDPPVVPTPVEVNAWSLQGLAHDSINAHVCVEARCAREDVETTCATCEGHGSAEKYPGQRAEAEAWEDTEPPTGEGWQLWETVSEGSPISPVFAGADGLIEWMTTPAAQWGAMGPWSRETAIRFVLGAGWAPTCVGSAAGLQDGVTWAAGDGS